jgi:hypothetical protein
MTQPRFTGADAPVGARVITADGEDLGTVKETRSVSFKVDAAMKPDYWLSCNYIEDSTPSGIKLAVTKDSLETAKVEG